MRPLWFLVGVGAGAYAVVRARRAAEALTPEGLSDRAAGLRLGWEMFSDEVRAGMAEKETELRAAMLAAPDGATTPRLETGAGRGRKPDGAGADQQTDQQTDQQHRAEGGNDGQQ